MSLKSQSPRATAAAPWCYNGIPANMVYRFEFTVPTPPDWTMIQYYKPHVTHFLREEAFVRRDEFILDLLPGDAARMIDWRGIKRFMPVVKAEYYYPRLPTFHLLKRHVAQHRLPFSPSILNQKRMGKEDKQTAREPVANNDQFEVTKCDLKRRSGREKGICLMHSQKMALPR